LVRVWDHNRLTHQSAASKYSAGLILSWTLFFLLKVIDFAQNVKP
jgi:hypothetical protein